MQHFRRYQKVVIGNIVFLFLAFYLEGECHNHNVNVFFVAASSQVVGRVKLELWEAMYFTLVESSQRYIFILMIKCAHKYSKLLMQAHVIWCYLKSKPMAVIDVGCDWLP